MHLSNSQREAAIRSAEASYFSFSRHLEHLFDACSFYLQRYPSDGSASDIIRTKDLLDVVTELGSLPVGFGDVLRRWKSGEVRVLSRLGTEIHLLNEIWANVTCLVMFLTCRGIDLEPFDLDRAKADWDNLKRVNALIS
jgi:hypothetical protein